MRRVTWVAVDPAQNELGKIPENPEDAEPAQLGRTGAAIGLRIANVEAGAEFEPKGVPRGALSVATT